ALRLARRTVPGHGLNLECQNPREQTMWPSREVHMDMPSSAPVGSLIDRAATGVVPGRSEAALDQAKYLHHAGSPWFLALTALGVVFGDIGTSPLYAFQVALSGTGHPAPTAADVLGIVSLILWALMVMVSLKYVVFVLRADNDGEGGILALLSLVGADQVA